MTRRPGDAWSVRASVRAYGLAIRLFPAGFRARFGEELAEAFAEAARERHAHGRLRGLARLWPEAAADLIVHAGGERWAAWRGRESGLPLRDERAAARRARPVIRDVRGGAGMLETLTQDVRFAVRTLAKTPGFTAAVVATIALGVGATTAIFTVVNGIVLRPLPFPGSDRAIMICETNPSMGSWCGASPPNLADMARASSTLEAAGLARSEPFIAQIGGAPVGANGGITTPGFFRVLGMTPALGRLFEDRDLNRGANHVVVASDAFWRQHLGADPAAVGRAITIDGAAFTLIGVLPPDVFIPVLDDTELWEPLTASSENVDERSWRGFVPLGRIKAGQTLTSVATELRTLHAQLAQAYPDANRDWGVRVVGLRSRLVGSVSQTLWIFLGAVGFVLLIACANVASLLLVRATGRAPEFAVRASLGAGQRRLVRQLLTESLVVSFAGGALGLALAVWATRAFVSLAPATIPRLDEVGLDGRVALFAFLLSTATAVFFGFAPARRASRTDLSGTLKGLRQTDPGDARLRAAFVVVQLALALVLLVGAGLLTRSFGSLLNWQPGFERSGVITSFLLPPGHVYQTRDQMQSVMNRVRDAVATVPGVAQAGLTSGGPLFGGGDGTSGLLVEGRPPGDPQTRLQVEFYDMDPHYFETLGVRIVRGRNINAGDTFGAAPVAVVNEALARSGFPGEDPIGRRVTVADHPAEIVGIVADTRPYRPDQATPPQVYWPIAQYPRGAAELVMRAPTSLEGFEKTVRARVAEIDPEIQLGSFYTLDAAFERRLVSPRFNMLLVGAFALVAVLLAAIGVYGVVAYSVASRTREIGVRVALGAAPRRIVRQVVRGGMALAAVGLAIGLAGAVAVGRLITTLLYGMPPTDPLTLVGAVGLFVLVVLVACWVPARRAARVDPVVALRTE